MITFCDGISTARRPEVVQNLPGAGDRGLAVCWICLGSCPRSQDHMADVPLLFLLHQTRRHFDQIHSTGKPFADDKCVCVCVCVRTCTCMIASCMPMCVYVFVCVCFC
jgi:hypothetical protein